MKEVITLPKAKQASYPKLMTNIISSEVAIFYKECEGALITGGRAGNSIDTRGYTTNWKDFDGSVTLSNS